MSLCRISIRRCGRPQGTTSARCSTGSVYRRWFVTHDQEDAFAIADRIAVIRKGRLLQVGTPEELYNSPASLGVASFIGRATILPAEAAGDRIGVHDWRREARVRGPHGTTNARATKPMMVVLRPDTRSSSHRSATAPEARIVNQGAKSPAGTPLYIACNWQTGSRWKSVSQSMKVRE